MTDTARLCVHCSKPTADGSNYCNWECSVARAKAAGGTVHTPNGLPIGSIRHDNAMFEHEHGDHPDYMFPVDVDYIGEVCDSRRSDFEMIHGRPPKDDADVRNMEGETHALIFTDGTVALTMYECCYALWLLRNGEWYGGETWHKQHRLSEASCTTIREHVATNGKGAN